MKHSGSKIVLNAASGPVIFHSFAVVTLTHGLRDLEARLQAAAGNVPPWEYSIEREFLDDKYVLWAWIREDENWVENRCQMVAQAALYASQNGCLFLPIEAVSDRYSRLYWDIVESLSESEDDTEDLEA